MKRSYGQMMDHPHTPYVVHMGGSVAPYHDFPQQHYCSPQAPPQQALLFSNSFPSPTEYVNDGYMPATENMGYFTGDRSLSEPFVHQATESFHSSSSDTSSCNVSLGPATPPPMKFPAVPITPSHVVPRQKAKRTATVSRSFPLITIICHLLTMLLP